TRLADELLGQRRALAMRDHPADHVPAEDVEHDVQVEVGPLRGPEELGDVPAPELVGPAGQQLRGRIKGVPAVGAPRAAPAPRRARPGGDTSSARNTDTGPRRAGWRRPRPAPGPRSVACATARARPRVPPRPGPEAAAAAAARPAGA